MLKADTYNELKKTKIAFIVLIIASVIIVSYNIIFTRSLKKNFFITLGKVIKISNRYKSSPSAEYIYTINGNVYNGSVPHPDFINSNDRYVLVDKYFPVLVDSTDYTNKIMIFDSLSFAYFGLKYPDSLRWLKRYINE